MKNLSHWAKANPIKSRAFIALVHLLVGGAAFYAGIWLFAKEQNLPLLAAQAIGGVGALALLFYPAKQFSWFFFAWSYRRQKALDTVLVASGMALLTCAGNVFATHTSADALSSPQPKVVALRRWPSPDGTAVQGAFKNKWQHLKSLWKQGRHAVKGHVTALRSAKLTGGQVALVILSILGGMALLYLAIALSCSVSCNGNEVLGGVLFFGGIALVITLYVLAMRAIFKKTGNVKQGIVGGLIAFAAALVATVLILRGG